LRSSFVPLAEASEVDDQIQVPHARTLVKDAPNIEADGQLSEAEEAKLYRHYGLDYDTVTPDSDQRTGQPGGPADQDQLTAPAATDEPAAAPTGRPVERRGDEELLEATDAMGSAQSPSDEGLGVGEGVSQPFVYETPGPAQGRPGSRPRQPGVRLRRYLVTEVVTETEAGQRHELRVEREPISDQEVEAVPADPNRSDASIQPGSPTPDSNDWFRPEGAPPR
jgi:hypothetical protein